MSDRYEIRYLPTAEKDLYDIFDYIQQDNLSATPYYSWGSPI